MPKSELALLGGPKVREKPFPKTFYVNDKEILDVMEVFRDQEFSRFSGGPSAELEKLLVMKSKEVLHYQSLYWNCLGGQKIKAFESDIAEFFEVDFAITVNSATSALSVAFGALGLGPGDEIIVPCMSFTATATSVLLFNCIPVFVDVDPKTFCIDPDSVRKAITDKTKAILVVHLLGNSANMDAIMEIAKEHNLYVVEDCAQAPGTKYKGEFVGSIGDMGIYSLQETKNFSTGEGGIIVTDNETFARRCRLIRNHGEAMMSESASIDDLVNNVGCNFRMTEITAAIGIAQLKKLPALNKARNENAFYLMEELKDFNGLEMPYIPAEVEYVCHLLALLYDQKAVGVPRTVFVKALQAEGVSAGTGYIRLMYQNPLFLRKIAFGRRGCPFECQFYRGSVEYKNGMCPVGEDLIRNKFIWLYQLNYPATIDDMEDIVQAFKKIYFNIDDLKKIREEDISMEYGR